MNFKSDLENEYLVAKYLYPIKLVVRFWDEAKNKMD
jgi:hypothetical protein